MNLTRLVTTAWLLVCATSAAAETPRDAIVGVWLTEQADSKIEISRAGAGYAGKVVWLKEGERNGRPPVDEKNAEPALRSRPILGLEVVAVAYDSGSNWHGTLYSPRKGRSFPAELSLSGARLAVKAKDGIFSKTVSWTRAQ